MKPRPYELVFIYLFNYLMLHITVTFAGVNNFKQ